MGKSDTKGKIGIDIGYGHTKVYYQDNITKFQTAICYASDIGISYGDHNTYEFEGELYYVGKEAVGSDAFFMSDYEMIKKFAPIIIYHVLSKFEEVKLIKPIEVRTGLSIMDFDRKEDFKKRIEKFEVNEQIIETKPLIMAQGAGSVYDWVYNTNNGVFPKSIMAIDIGYNTVNVLRFVDGKPIRKDMRPYTESGVSSAIKKFSTFLQLKYNMGFSDQESLIIFNNGEFIYKGELQEDVSKKIKQLTNEFVKTTLMTVINRENKNVSLSEVVIVSGGGAYLINRENISALKDYKQIIPVDKPFEYSNVRGYMS